jgi:molecular chaperone Hsp33
VFVDRGGQVEAAGGYIIQVMGGLADDDLESIEQEVAALPHPTTMIRARRDARGHPGAGLRRRVQRAGAHPGPVPLPVQPGPGGAGAHPPGPGEIDAIMAQQEARGHSDVTCEFCGANYRFTLDQLAALKN